MTARAIRIPDTEVRGVFVPDSVAVMYWPAADAAPNPPYVSLAGRMDIRFGHGDGALDFTIPGWRAFIAAVKAGEFDSLIDDTSG